MQPPCIDNYFASTGSSYSHDVAYDLMLVQLFMMCHYDVMRCNGVMPVQTTSKARHSLPSYTLQGKICSFKWMMSPILVFSHGFYPLGPPSAPTLTAVSSGSSMTITFTITSPIPCVLNYTITTTGSNGEVLDQITVLPEEVGSPTIGRTVDVCSTDLTVTATPVTSEEDGPESTSIDLTALDPGMPAPPPPPPPPPPPNLFMPVGTLFCVCVVGVGGGGGGGWGV